MVENIAVSAMWHVYVHYHKKLFVFIPKHLIEVVYSDNSLLVFDIHIYELICINRMSLASQTTHQQKNFSIPTAFIVRHLP